ncbi:hypothetical protein GPALN_009737 [Globodera pallida]|nr:hypothetical protein GPALN_009737 [Globodera pallida]
MAFNFSKGYGPLYFENATRFNATAPYNPNILSAFNNWVLENRPKPMPIPTPPGSPPPSPGVQMHIPVIGQEIAPPQNYGNEPPPPGLEDEQENDDGFGEVEDLGPEPLHHQGWQQQPFHMQPPPVALHPVHIPPPPLPWQHAQQQFVAQNPVAQARPIPLNRIQVRWPIRPWHGRPVDPRLQRGPKQYSLKLRQKSDGLVWHKTKIRGMTLNMDNELTYEDFKRMVLEYKEGQKKQFRYPEKIGPNKDSRILSKDNAEVNEDVNSYFVVRAKIERLEYCEYLGCVFCRKGRCKCPEDKENFLYLKLALADETGALENVALFGSEKLEKVGLGWRCREDLCLPNFTSKSSTFCPSQSSRERLFLSLTLIRNGARNEQALPAHTPLKHFLLSISATHFMGQN